MSMQIPDYSVFAQMPVSARRQSFEMIKRFAGQHAATLYLQVFQFDPDTELREMARRELAAQGITPPTEPTPMTGAPNANAGASFGGYSGVPDSSAGASFGGSSFSFGGVTVDDALPAAVVSNIDGGTGRPIERGPQNANVFTLTRGNSAYLTGEKAHLAHSPWVYLLVLGIFTFVFAILFVAFRAFNSGITGGIFTAVLALVGGILALISVIIIGVWIYNIRRNRRFERQGQLLMGKILGANGQWITSYSSEGGTTRSYRVTVAYRVRLPDGSVFDDEKVASRDDLARTGLPMPGSPVAVLVIDKEHMRLL